MKALIKASVVCALFVAQSAMAALPENAKAITDHLEFLGYKADTSDDVIMAKHPSNPTLIVRGVRGGIQVGVVYRGRALNADERAKLLEVVNEFNSGSVGVKFYTNKSNYLIGEGFYPGAYEKSNFGSYLEHFNLTVKYQLSIARDRLLPLLSDSANGAKPSSSQDSRL